VLKLSLRVSLLAVLGVLLAAGFGAAATLGVGSSGLAAGSAPTTGCQSGALAFSRTVDNAGTVTSVTVGNVSQACAGATLTVTLGSTAGYASLAERSATVPSPCSGGCSLTFAGLGSVAARTIGAYSAAVVGP
jgi:hypothetical protein